MTDNDRVDVAIATGVAVTVAEDGNYVALSFGTHKEPVNIAVPAQKLGHMIAHLIEAAENIASQHVTSVQREETVTALPIPVAAMGIAKGRTEAEALLSIRTGPLTLVFAVDLSTLRGTCENLLQITERRPGPKRPH